MTGSGMKAANKHLGGGIKHQIKKHIELKEEIMGAKKRLHEGVND